MINDLTPEQLAFFEQSKVRDNEGNLLVCYHGSNSNFNEFDFNKSSFGNALGRGFYFSSSEDIAKYYSDNIDAYYLNIKNPYIYAKNGAPQNFLVDVAMEFDISVADTRKSGKTLNDLVTDVLKSKGYDGIMAYNEAGEYEIVAYYSNQIKKATNLNPTDSNNVNESIRKRKGYNINDNIGNATIGNAAFNMAMGAGGCAEDFEFEDNDEHEEILLDDIDQTTIKRYSNRLNDFVKQSERELDAELHEAYTRENGFTSKEAMIADRVLDLTSELQSINSEFDGVIEHQNSGWLSRQSQLSADQNDCIDELNKLLYDWHACEFMDLPDVLSALDAITDNDYQFLDKYNNKVLSEDQERRLASAILSKNNYRINTLLSEF